MKGELANLHREQFARVLIDEEAAVFERSALELVRSCGQGDDPDWTTVVVFALELRNTVGRLAKEVGGVFFGDPDGILELNHDGVASTRHDDTGGLRGPMTKHEVLLYWSEEDRVFIAEVPELPGCAADGATRQEALASVERVMAEWIETATELRRPIPAPKGRAESARVGRHLIR